MGEEVYAFSDALDCAYSLNYDLEAMLQKFVPLDMSTDSKSLYQVFRKCSNTEEKRLMIYIHSAKKVHDLEEISKIYSIKSANNPTDAFSTVRAYSTLSQDIYPNCSIFPDEQWVYRLKEDY